MKRIIHVPSTATQHTDVRKDFQQAVLSGLKRPKKRIESKFMYDERGSALFNQITRHPDYYLTNCELEILNRSKSAILKLIGDEPFNLIELGPGEGIKTKILLDYFLSQSRAFSYMPIDISENYLQSLFNDFNAISPNIDLMPIHADYIQGLTWLSRHAETRSVVLFLGSSIGNFELERTHRFLRDIRKSLRCGDYLLLGFDLRKEIDILMRAYNDSAGITREFNLNLLKRINRELEADFDLDHFDHYATYNVYTGAMESYLVSLIPQSITLQKGHEVLQLAAFEPIHVEYSYKYLLSQISSFATNAGFTLVQNFLDEKEYFVDSLWCVEK